MDNPPGLLRVLLKAVNAARLALCAPWILLLLSTQPSVVFNHGDWYVRLVLGLAEQYK